MRDDENQKEASCLNHSQVVVNKNVQDGIFRALYDQFTYLSQVTKFCNLFFLLAEKDDKMTDVSHKRGRIEKIKLKKSIKINSYTISKALIEIDHINNGLDKSGRLKNSKRSNFTIKDIEKFIMMLDQEDLMPRRYKGSKSHFEIRIDCPILGKFYQRQFVMIFDLDHKEPDMIHTITIFPGW